MPEELLQEFAQLRPRLVALEPNIRELFESLLRVHGFNVHSISTRVKDEESLAGKLVRGGGKYEALAEITDLLGVRIITYFKDDVDAVGALVEDEFDIDRASSVDKRALLDPDRFGYLSLHYVVSIVEQGSTSAEVEEFSALRFEIQIRTLLQHAWAEIEHDLGYKSSIEVPREVRRQFSRLAGLLELGDEGFSSIRATLEEYAARVQIGARLAPEGVSIDAQSVKALLEEDLLFSSIDEEIASQLGVQLIAPPAFYISDLSSRLQHAGFMELGSIQEGARARRALLVSLATAWLLESKPRTVPKGVSLFFLAYLEIVTSLSPSEIESFFIETGIQKSPKPAGELAERLISTFESIEMTGPSD